MDVQTPWGYEREPATGKHRKTVHREGGQRRLPFRVGRLTP
jgi:hypothetical protein